MKVQAEVNYTNYRFEIQKDYMDALWKDIFDEGSDPFMDAISTESTLTIEVCSIGCYVYVDITPDDFGDCRETAQEVLDLIQMYIEEL